MSPMDTPFLPIPSLPTLSGLQVSALSLLPWIPFSLLVQLPRVHQPLGQAQSILQVSGSIPSSPQGLLRLSVGVHSFSGLCFCPWHPWRLSG